MATRFAVSQLHLLLAAVAMSGAVALADHAKAPDPAPPAAALAPALTDQLMTIGRLPDIVQGSASAPVTIIEYASMTCSHCAAFHDTTWPELKRKYVDSGRAKFILREFPLDPLAAAAFMLGRCVGSEQRNLLIDRLFAQQKTWAFVDKPAAPLLAIAGTIGFSPTSFEACLGNRDLYEQMSQGRERAAQALDIKSTPTFFVNGRKLTGALTIADFDKAIAPLTR